VTREKRSLSPSLWLYFLPLVVIASIYVGCLPHTVQDQDTGELIAGAYNRFVVHPPGYPLFLWLEYLATHLIPWGTVFWRASLLNALFACGALALVGWPLRRSPLVLLVLLPLAASPVYWRYAELPDVFALNNLIAAAIFFLFFARPVSTSRAWGLAILFGLGAANQHTIVFLFPLVAYGILERRSWKTAAQSLALFAVIVVGSYLSLFALRHDALYSWGNVDSLGALIDHFLRREIGTFQLTAAHVHATLGTSVAYFLLAVGTEPFALILIGLGSVRLREKRYAVGLFSFALYGLAICLAFSLPQAYVTERFYILALIMVGSLATAAAARLPSRSSDWLVWSGAVAALVLVGVDISRCAGVNDLSQNTIVEDYAINLLSMSRDDKRAIFILGGDTRVFSMRYAQTVLHLHPDAIVMGLENIFDQARLDKLRKLRPGFGLARDVAWVGGSREVVSNMVAPNVGQFEFYFSRGFASPDYHVTYLGLGRRVTAGHGVSVDYDSVSRLHFRSGLPELSEAREFDERKELYSEYAYIYLEAGLLAHEPAKAGVWFAKALEIVPYCLPALRNLCELERSGTEREQACEAHWRDLSRREWNYF